MSTRHRSEFINASLLTCEPKRAFSAHACGVQQQQVGRLPCASMQSELRCETRYCDTLSSEWLVTG